MVATAGPATPRRSAQQWVHHGTLQQAVHVGASPSGSFSSSVSRAGKPEVPASPLSTSTGNANSFGPVSTSGSAWSWSGTQAHAQSGIPPASQSRVLVYPSQRTSTSPLLARSAQQRAISLTCPVASRQVPVALQPAPQAKEAGEVPQTLTHAPLMEQSLVQSRRSLSTRPAAPAARALRLAPPCSPARPTVLPIAQSAPRALTPGGRLTTSNVGCFAANTTSLWQPASSSYQLGKSALAIPCNNQGAVLNLPASQSQLAVWRPHQQMLPVPSVTNPRFTTSSVIITTSQTQVAPTYFNTRVCPNNTDLPVIHYSTSNHLWNSSSIMRHINDGLNRNWMDQALAVAFPFVAQFIGMKIKAALWSKGINQDRVIDIGIKKLSQTPPTLPLTSEWINNFISVLWPMVHDVFSSLIKKWVLPIIRSKLPSFLQSIDIDPCELGKTPPRFKPPIHVLNNPKISGGWVDYAIDLEYDGDAHIELKYRSHQVGVKNIKLSLRLYVSFYGFLPKPPFFHGLSVYLCETPKLDLKWGGLLEFLDMHFIEDIVHKAMSDSIGKMMLLPNRMVVPVATPTECNILDIKRPKPRGILQIRVLEAEGLVGNEYDLSSMFTGEMSTDPFVQIKIGAESFKTNTLWNTCNPKWDKDGKDATNTSNTHFFFVDIPDKQLVHIHVYDDGCLQKLKQIAHVDGAESDEIARKTGLSVSQLLGRPHWDPLQEEILVEKWIDLDSWWTGRGLGPDKEDFASARVNEKGSQGEDINAPSCPREDGGFFNDALQWAKEKMKEKLANRDADQKEKLEQARARVRLRAHWRCVGWTWPAVPNVQQIASARESSLGFTSAVMSNQAVMPNPSPPSVQTNSGTHGACLPRTFLPTDQADITNTAAQQISANSGVMATSSDDSSSEDDIDSKGKGNHWDGWPTYLLRVGVEAVEKVPCAVHEIDKAFSATIEALPVVTQDGKDLAESTEKATMVKTKPKKPKRASVAGLAKSMEESEELTRKVGLLMVSGVPEEMVARILDLNMKSARKLMGKALTDIAGRRDVKFNEAQVYLLRKKHVTVNVEVKSHVAKQEPTSLGKATIKVSEVFKSKHMYLEKRRLLLEGASGARVDIACQVWPVLNSGVPVERLIEAAVAPERLANQAAGKGVETKIWIYRARSLRNADLFGGKSDPYCLAYLEGLGKRRQVVETKVIDNDPDPIWNHEQKVTWMGEGQLCFEVYDKDFGRKGDLLGEATLSKEECFRGVNTELCLGDGNGVLHVQVALIRNDVAIEVPYMPPVPKPRLQIWVLAAERLKAVNLFWGKSDPYVICQLSDSKKFQTQAIHSELNPRWEFGPQELVLESELNLQFEVRDKDLVGSSRLGMALLTRDQCLAGFEGFLNLGEGCGRLRVKVCAYEPEPESAPVDLCINVLAANDLRNADLFGGKSDPYVICKVAKKEIFRTEVIWDEPNPKWDHKGEHILLRSTEELVFEVYDKDLLRQGDHLGTATVNQQLCIAGIDEHLDLGAGNGTLHVQIFPASAEANTAATDEVHERLQTVRSSTSSPHSHTRSRAATPSASRPLSHSPSGTATPVGKETDVGQSSTGQQGTRHEPSWLMSQLAKRLPCGLEEHRRSHQQLSKETGPDSEPA